jgi:exopolyphosphatase/guanosine-5'-triphosphate,3'-diphosphate pyrophosphatase
MRFAAIDIGSNTFRLLIAEPSQNKKSTPWQTIYYTHRITRLGEGLHHSGELSDAGMSRAMQALNEFSALLQRFDVSPCHTLAAATAAIREAENGMLFKNRVKAKTGIDIQIFAAGLEASTALCGACAVLEPDTSCDMLLFDIGGGSTEFTRTRNTEQHDAISRKLGVVRLVEAHLHSDPPSSQDYQSMIEAVSEHLRAVEEKWSDSQPPKHLVGTAGTVTTLAATELDLFPYDASVINNHCMSKSAFFSLRDRLLALNHKERLQIRTIEAGREDLIIAGLAIIEAIIQRWNYDDIITVDAGMLEGTWLRASRLNLLQNS